MHAESHAYINHFEVDVSGCADLCDKEAYCKASLYNSKNTKCYLYVCHLCLHAHAHAGRCVAILAPLMRLQ